jgi:hypothetical protein
VLRLLVERGAKLAAVDEAAVLAAINGGHAQALGYLLDESPVGGAAVLNSVMGGLSGQKALAAPMTTGNVDVLRRLHHSGLDVAELLSKWQKKPETHPAALSALREMVSAAPESHVRPRRDEPPKGIMSAAIPITTQRHFDVAAVHELLKRDPAAKALEEALVAAATANEEHVVSAANKPTSFEVPTAASGALRSSRVVSWHPLRLPLTAGSRAALRARRTHGAAGRPRQVRAGGGGACGSPGPCAAHREGHGRRRGRAGVSTETRRHVLPRRPRRQIPAARAAAAQAQLA